MKHTTYLHSFAIAAAFLTGAIALNAQNQCAPGLGLSAQQIAQGNYWYGAGSASDLKSYPTETGPAPFQNPSFIASDGKGNVFLTQGKALVEWNGNQQSDANVVPLNSAGANVVMIDGTPWVLVGEEMDQIGLGNTVLVPSTTETVFSSGGFFWTISQGWSCVSNIGSPNTCPPPSSPLTGTPIAANEQNGNLKASQGQISGSVTGTKFPSGIFDGTSLWIVAQTGNKVYQVNPSNGSVLMAVTVGSAPKFIAFDGVNIWVTNSKSGTVSRFAVGNPSNVDTIPVGNDPEGIAFDGRLMWVANRTDNTISQIRVCDGVVLGTVPGGGDPYQLAYDGSRIWVTNPGTNTISIR